jgi:hypothetical protein
MALLPWSNRSFPWLVRIGLTGLVLTTIGGFVASGRHLVDHHANRDENPGLSMDDIRGAYHGVRTTAPLVTALERDHPADVTEDVELLITDDERTLLRKWLASDRISEDYDNLDLGDAAPAEILSFRCLACHSRQATDDVAGADGVGERIPLDFWDDVRKVAFSREINPVDVKILTTSTHTHALSLATLSFVVVLLLLGARVPRVLVGVATAVIGVALMMDIAAWWLARPRAEFVWIVVGAGGVYNAAMVLALLVILVDLWWPGGEAAGEGA